MGWRGCFQWPKWPVFAGSSKRCSSGEGGHRGGIKRIYVAGGGKSKKKQRMDCLLNDVLTDEKLRARVLKFLIYFGVTDEVHVCKHTSVYLKI